LTHKDTRKILKLLVKILPILFLALIIIPTTQTTHAQTTNNPWAIKLQILNDQNVTANLFRPFDSVQLRANVTYNNASQSNVLVFFKVIGPSSTPINITRIETTNQNGLAELSFRIPILGQSEDSIIGTWNASVTINGAQPQKSNFTTQWSLETTSIELSNSQGQNQTSFSPGSNIAINLTIKNNGPAQQANITLKMQDLSSKIINQTNVLNSQIASYNQTQVQASLQIPDNAASGQGIIDVAVNSGTFNGTEIPAAENQIVQYTINTNNSATSPTPTPSSTPTQGPTPTPYVVENTVSLVSWLLVATGFFTFTLLYVFLKRKPIINIGPQLPNLPATETNQTMTNDATLKQPTTQQPQPTSSIAKEAFERTAQPTTNTQASVFFEAWATHPEPQSTTSNDQTQIIAEHLTRISSIGRRVQIKEAELKLEREQLSKEVMDLKKTLEEQERAAKNYFDTIRQAIASIDPTLSEMKNKDDQQKNTDEQAKKD